MALFDRPVNSIASPDERQVVAVLERQVGLWNLGVPVTTDECPDQKGQRPRDVEGEPNDSSCSSEREQRADSHQPKGFTRNLTQLVELQVKRTLEDDDRDGEPNDGRERFGPAKRFQTDEIQAFRTDSYPSQDQEQHTRYLEAIGQDLRNGTEPENDYDERERSPVPAVTVPTPDREYRGPI